MKYGIEADAGCDCDCNCDAACFFFINSFNVYFSLSPFLFLTYIGLAAGVAYFQADAV